MDINNLRKDDFKVKDVIQFMVNLAKRAGRIQMRNYNKAYATDWDRHHMRSVIDERIGILVRKEIEKYNPNISIMSEELPDKVGDQWKFVVDEIDGTNPYFRKFGDHFSFSIGLYRGVIPRAGVVFAPKRKEMYVGSDLGAFCNGEKLFANRTTDINKVWMLICSGKHDRQSHIPYLERAQAEDGISNNVEFGAAAISLCFVAAGKLDAVLGTALAPEDMAGAIPICLAAGLKATNFYGESWTLQDQTVLVANPILHEKLTKFFNLKGR